MVDAVTGLRTPMTSGMTVGMSARGAYLRNDAVGSLQSLLVDYTKLKNDWTDAVTVGAIGRNDAHNLTSNFDFGYSAGGGNDFLLNFGHANNEQAVMRIGNGAGNQSTAMPLPDPTNYDWTNWQGVFGWRVNGLGQKIHMHNDFSDAIDSLETASPNLLAHNLELCRNGNSGEPGDVLCFAVWNRVISDADMRSFYDNPWQIFQPRYIHVPLEPEIVVPSDVIDSGNLTFEIPVWYR
jgi:hypothetical protein